MHHFNQLMETGQLINQFMRLWDSRGRVLVVPFQNVSLKGILVKFCPIFSALSVGEENAMRKLITKPIKKAFESVQMRGARIPLSSSRRWGLPLSSGVSPYLLQMLTWAPLVTRSWEKRKILEFLLWWELHVKLDKSPPGGALTSATWSWPQKQA